MYAVEFRDRSIALLAEEPEDAIRSFYFELKDIPSSTDDREHRIVPDFDNQVLTLVPIEDEVSKPTQLDLIEAQLTYTAMMTDTLLEV